MNIARLSGWELLDSRWNGNEAFRWTTDRGPFFVKMNRVEDMSVFMTEVRLHACVYVYICVLCVCLSIVLPNSCRTAAITVPGVQG